MFIFNLSSSIKIKKNKKKQHEIKVQHFWKFLVHYECKNELCDEKDD